MFYEINNRQKILVVEDEIGIREGLLEFLKLEGYHAYSAQNGREGLEVLESQPLIDLILLDHRMPVMNGAEFRRAQLMNPSWAQIPVIVLSADFQMDELVRALEVQHYLRKPFQLDELLRLIQELVVSRSISSN